MDGVLLFDFFISQKFSYITGFFPTPEIATMASVSMVKKVEVVYLAEVAD